MKMRNLRNGLKMFSNWNPNEVITLTFTSRECGENFKKK